MPAHTTEDSGRQSLTTYLCTKAQIEYEVWQPGHKQPEHALRPRPAASPASPPPSPNHNCRGLSSPAGPVLASAWTGLREAVRARPRGRGLFWSRPDLDWVGRRAGQTRNISYPLGGRRCLHIVHRADPTPNPGDMGGKIHRGLRGA